MLDGEVITELFSFLFMLKNKTLVKYISSP